LIYRIYYKFTGTNMKQIYLKDRSRNGRID
jgi:hypothetical protein